MPHREKIAWLSLLAMALTVVPYLTFMALNPPGEGMPNLPVLGLYAATAVAQAVVLGLGYLVLRLRSLCSHGRQR